MPVPIETQTGAIHCASEPDVVVAFLADPVALSAWSESVRLVEGNADTGWIVVTAGGRAPMAVDVDARRRVVRYAVQDPEWPNRGAIFRITPRPRAGSVIAITRTVPPEADPNLFGEVIDRELGRLAALIDARA